MAAFHYSFHVKDLDSTRRFYGGLLDCREGRSTATWVDFDFFGSQISAHLGEPARTTDTGRVEDLAVPLPHFGAIVSWQEFAELSARLLGAGVMFLISPRVRFPGEPGEQATMFLSDFSGNALEFKAFKDPNQVFTS